MGKRVFDAVVNFSLFLSSICLHLPLSLSLILSGVSSIDFSYSTAEVISSDSGTS